MHASKCKELTQAINRRKAMHRQCISQYSATGRMPTHEAVHAYIIVSSLILLKMSSAAVEDMLRVLRKIPGIGLHVWFVIGKVSPLRH